MADGIITRRGGTQAESKPLDLPIDIQLTQPTPKRVGHLWIKADIASQITKITIDRALKANVVDGTLQLIASVDPHRLAISQSILITSNKEVPIAMTTSATTSKWQVSDVTGDSVISVFLDSYPLVYSTLNGVLEIETAYIWNGASWEITSEKGAFSVYGDKVYRIQDADRKFFAEGTLDGTADTQMSADGRYFIHGSLSNANYKVYKRVGLVVSLLHTIGNQFVLDGYTCTIKRLKLSKTGRIICIAQSSAYKVAVQVLDCTPSGIVEVQKFFISDTKLMESALYCWLYINEDASRIATFVKSDNNAGDTGAPVFIATARLRTDGVYEKTGRITQYTNSVGTLLPLYAGSSLTEFMCQYYGSRLHVAFGTGVRGYATIDSIFDITLPYADKAFIDKAFVAPKVGVSFNNTTNLSVYYYDTELIESFTITWGAPSFPFIVRTMCASLDGYVYILAKNDSEIHGIICYKLVYTNGKISGATYVSPPLYGFAAGVKYTLGVSPTSIFNS